MSPLYRTVGPYEIRGELGSGGMADVFVAVDGRSGATVALKIPRRDADVRAAERVGALLQASLAELDDRVARVYEIGEDDGVPYVAMEYVEGEDLSERIARGPLPPEDAIRIAIELCDLLANAHAFAPVVDGRPRHGIVHGDLKPRNVRLARCGRVRVVDFGIAKALSETRKRTHNEFGSLPYSSPERIDTGHVDAHSDVWAVAVVLYEMLTTRPPFRADHPRGLEHRILSGVRPEPPAGGLPGLDAVLGKALAPRLADRYAGAAELRADLDAVLRGAPTCAELEPALVAAGAGTSTDDTATRRTAEDGATRRTVDDGATRRSGTGDGPGPDADATRRAAPDPDATRRTGAESAAAVDPDATHRWANGNGSAGTPHGAAASAPASGATIPGTPATAAAANAAASLARGFHRFVRISRRIAIVGAVVLVANEVMAFQQAGEVVSRLPGYSRGEAAQVWSEYRAVQRRSTLRIAAMRAGGPVKDWHVGKADDLMSSYLSATPTIREGGWKQAAALLRRASAIAPGDDRIEARRRYCAGQLARIDAEARLERSASGSTALFNDARRAFEEAARLRRGWPDPWLGLARVHAIGYQDVEQTREALDGASRARYRLGDRETALMGDAHRLRAEKAWKAVPGLPDEERYLEQIRSDCWRALELYGEVPAHGQVSRNIRRVHALLAQVRAREDLLGGADPESTTTEVIEDVARAAGSLLGIE